MTKRTATWLAVLAALSIHTESFARKKKVARPTPKGTYEKLLGQIDQDEMAETISDFSALESRVVGYSGYRRAQNMVYRKFRELGLERVEKQAFKVPVPIEERSELVLDAPRSAETDGEAAGRADRLRLRSLWPNLVRTSQTPPEGIHGHLVYGHRGEVNQFNGKDVEGSIALLDFNSGGEWFNTLLLGAKAVIFIEPETTLRGEAESKFLTTPINIPRFWIDAESAELLKQRLEAGEKVEGTVRCQMRWQMKRAVNIVGWIEGSSTQPVVEGSETKFKDEFAVVHAYYDSMSVVPSLAPGAEMTCGLSALFQLIKAFQAAPPRRSVMFFASGAHCVGLEGVRHFIDRYVESKADSDEQKTWKTDQRARFRLFATLDLSSQTENAGVFYKGHFIDQNESAIQWQFSDIGKRSRETAEAITSENRRTKRAIGREWQEEFFVDGVNPLKGKNWRTYLPGKFALASEIATLAAYPGIGIVTVNDSRPRTDTPFDTADHVRVPRVFTQTQVASCVLWDVISATDDILDLELDKNFVRLGGWMYRFNPETDYMPSTPVPEALCVARPQWGTGKTLSGVRGDIVTLDDEEGVFEFVGLPLVKAKGGQWTIEGFQTYAGTSDLSREQVRDARALLKELQKPEDPVSELIRDELSADVRKELDAFAGTSAPDKSLVKGVVAVVNGLLNGTDLYNAFTAAGMPRTGAIQRLLDAGACEAGNEGTPRRRLNRLLLEATYAKELWTGAAEGDIVFAPDRGTQGAETYPIQIPLDLADKKLTVVLFRCRAMNIFDMIDQRRFSLLREIHIYDAETEAQPFEFGVSLPIPQPLVSYYEPCAIIYAAEDATIKVTMGASILGLQFVLINATEKEWSGEGFSISEHPAIHNTPFRVAKDMWALDEHRLESFRKYGIENARVDRLHQTAAKFIDEAQQALDKKLYDRFLTNVRSAWSYEAKAYPDVQATANDVVKGIMFYLGLLLPFAYFAERLFFAHPNIHKQLAAATGIFLAVFIVIRYVHPAFEITITPLIVLLAFVILALTVIVSSIVMQKFEEQMRQIKFETGGMHSADVGRLSASAAAFSLGISNMRRRKTRTVLTCTTLIMLTFTVLSFTSVVSQTRANRIDLKKKPPYPGVLIRDRSWNALGEPTTRIVRNEYGDRFKVAPRAWYFSAMVGDQSFVNLDSEKERYAATALVGMTPEEIEVVKPLRKALTGRWFKPDDVLACIVPSGMAEVLKISKREVREGRATVTALGVELPVIGLLDGDTMQNIKDLDDEHLTPVDYLLMQERRREQTEQVTEGELEEYIHLTPDAVLYVPYDFVMNNGGNLRSLAMAFKSWDQVAENLDTLTERVELNLYAGVKDPKTGKLTTHLCSAVGSTGVKGAGSLFVPILIAGMIVLNTMLGSVYERVHEIGIFSSLGLAPVHIAALFIAEACVYAVLGGVAGYVTGQTLSKVIVAYHLAEGLNLNYSSLSAVASTVLIMVVVILSTIYPARKAAELAVPDVERRWRLPEPEGDNLRVPLPFTVSGTQAVGINAFLKEYMEAHADYSLGHFSADQVELGAQQDEQGTRVQLKAMVWLAPYDLGVSEHVTLDTVPTEDEWVNEVHITIRRESGDEASWLRTTRNFLNMVRKQFLIWRTLRPDLKEQYQQAGEELISSGA